MHQNGLHQALLLLAMWCTAAASVARAQDAQFYEYPGVSAAEILRARGFQADEMFMTTSDGYRLRITRARNPLTGVDASKDPVLFVHGVLATANDFLLNSFNATPKDFTGINLATTSLGQLNDMLASEPSARSLPLLALNFAREVWLVDRRGAPGSRELVGSVGAAEPRFWNYSLDEQARIDFPETIDFCLSQSGRSKLALVTHSAGGAIALMSQSLFPKRLAAKISSAIYWAPAYSVTNDNPVFSLNLALMEPLLTNYVGPYLPLASSMALQYELAAMCATKAAQATTCRALATSQFGEGGGREPARPELISNQFFPSSSHELAQLAQQVNYTPRSMRMFDYGPEGNQRAYQLAANSSSSPPPAYDLRRLRSRPYSMSFVVGSTDGEVTPADVATTLQQVQIPYKFRVIDPEIPFSHLGYFFNTEAPRLAIIPSMRELETLAG